MKITQPPQTKPLINDQINQLESILVHLTNNAIKPCSQCTSSCSCSQSSSCNCDCSTNCPLLAEVLSSDRINHPIESAILPLVYALNAMQVCQPFWSCEGHNDNKDQINKLPQIWFYTESVLLLRLMDQCISDLKMKKDIKYSWELAATFTASNNVSSAFSLKPNLSLEPCRSLAELQKDIIVIANMLPDKLLHVCQVHLKMLKKSLYSKTNFLE